MLVKSTTDHWLIPKWRQISESPWRDIFDVWSVNLEELKFSKSDDPRHGHDLRVLDAEDGQLAQEVDGVRRQALQQRLLDVDLTLRKTFLGSISSTFYRVCHEFRLTKRDDYIFGSILTTFVSSVISGASWGSSENWLEPKT